MMLQNQAYGIAAVYAPKDNCPVLSGSDICKAFSADDAFAFIPKFHTVLNRPIQIADE